MCCARDSRSPVEGRSRCMHAVMPVPLRLQDCALACPSSHTLSQKLSHNMKPIISNRGNRQTEDFIRQETPYTPSPCVIEPTQSHVALQFERQTIKHKHSLTRGMHSHVRRRETPVSLEQGIPWLRITGNTGKDDGDDEDEWQSMGRETSDDEVQGREESVEFAGS